MIEHRELARYLVSEIEVVNTVSNTVLAPFFNLSPALHRALSNSR